MVVQVIPAQFFREISNLCVAIDKHEFHACYLGKSSRCCELGRLRAVCCAPPANIQAGAETFRFGSGIQRARATGSLGNECSGHIRFT
jgi:hypothetical protein